MAPQAVIPCGGGFSWNMVDTNDSLGDNADFLVRLAMDHVTAKYRTDPERTVLTGFSEGGAVCRHIGYRTPYLFAGVIMMGCDYLPEYDRPAPAVGDRPPRFYFMAGERDAVAPAEGLQRAVKDYAAAGYAARCRIYPKVAHSFPIRRDEELREALDFVLQR
jgi:predicted esterase